MRFAAYGVVLVAVLFALFALWALILLCAVVVLYVDSVGHSRGGRFGGLFVLIVCAFFLFVCIVYVFVWLCGVWVILVAGGVALCFAVLTPASSCEVTCCVCCYAVSVVPGADDVVLCLRLLVSSSCGLGWFTSERFCGMVVLRCVLFYLWRAVFVLVCCFIVAACALVA